ncbi:MarC family protein [Sphingomonas sp. HT-1]|jgi:multiple antibiotic resistance protein|uniref:MarC family protein n=1 Tax=unclassified Sphingomonas TaxID=196159 RepID=UPI0002FE9949|nr:MULTISPECIES: MarC family protein [unclassified Sphingomonas]KTF70817.1 MarC family transcriptional regulator [Sphingomonas sp. WG]
MIELFVSSLVTFFVIIDPPGCAPIFAGLTAGTNAVHRRAMAVRAVMVAAIILFGFALFGEALLHALGISLNAFRIAGGIMLFLIALEMVFEKRTERREDRAEKVKAEDPVDISIFPMAMPMIAGPGSIASVMLLMSQSRGIQQSLVVLAAMLSILLLTLVALLAAGPIMRVVGAKIEAVVSRLLGVLLAALAVQFVIDGIRSSLAAG